MTLCITLCKRGSTWFHFHWQTSELLFRERHVSVYSVVGHLDSWKTCSSITATCLVSVGQPGYAFQQDQEEKKREGGWWETISQNVPGKHAVFCSVCTARSFKFMTNGPRWTKISTSCHEVKIRMDPSIKITPPSRIKNMENNYTL